MSGCSSVYRVRINDTREYLLCSYSSALRLPNNLHHLLSQLALGSRSRLRRARLLPYRGHRTGRHVRAALCARVPTELRSADNGAYRLISTIPRMFINNRPPPTRQMITIKTGTDCRPFIIGALNTATLENESPAVHDLIRYGNYDAFAAVETCLDFRNTMSIIASTPADDQVYERARKRS